MTSSIIIGVLAACLVFFHIRSGWVHRYRMRIIADDINLPLRDMLYPRLPSYEAMVFKFWVWPLSRFLKD